MNRGGFRSPGNLKIMEVREACTQPTKAPHSLLSCPLVRTGVIFLYLFLFDELVYLILNYKGCDERYSGEGIQACQAGCGFNFDKDTQEFTVPSHRYS